MLLDRNYLGLDPPHLRGADINLLLYHRGEERISTINRWRQEGHPTNENKQNCHITRCRLTFWNRPTLPQCGKEGVVLFGLHSRGVKC